MSTKLRMCPHCGNQNVIVVLKNTQWKVRCGHCFAEGPTGDTEVLAEQFWNSGYPTAYEK